MKPPEQLHTCQKCHHENFTLAGLKSHRCSPVMREHTVSDRKTDTLKLHPLLARFTMMRDVVDGLRKQKVRKPEHADKADEIESELAAFEATLDDEGILDPLKVTKEGLIADGRHRWQWAMRRNVKRVPCLEISDKEALRIIETMMIARRHLTKSMKAYGAVLLHPEVTELKHGGDRRSDQAQKMSLITQVDLAHRFGVSEGLVGQAVKLYRRLDELPQGKRGHFDRLVLAGFELGAIIAGTYGMEMREGKAIQEEELFKGIYGRLVRSASKLGTEWELYDKPEQRAAIAEGLSNFLAKIPQDLRETALAKLNEEGAS